MSIDEPPLAFESLFVYRKELIRYARQFVYDAADDIVQEAYIATAKRWPLREGSNARAYLYAVVINKMRSHSRNVRNRIRLDKQYNTMHRELQRGGSRGSLARRPVPLRRINLRIDIVRAMSFADLEAHPEWWCTDKMYAALHSLGPKIRQAILRFAINGDSVKELQKLAQKPTPGTILSRLYRARRALQKALNQEGNSVRRA